MPDTNATSGYTCECYDGFSGTFCDINIDDCLPVTCQNGGTCIDLVGGFQCSCPDNFGGQLCELECSFPNCTNCTYDENEAVCIQCAPGYFLGIDRSCCKSKQLLYKIIYMYTH